MSALGCMTADITAKTDFDANGLRELTALREGLENLGWTEGRNLRVDTRRAAGDTDAGNGRFVTQQTVENR
jgi:hypothetical protein